MGAAEKALDSALEAVARGRLDYILVALREGRRLLKRREEITSADIKARAPLPDDMEPRVLGVVMRQLAKEYDLYVSQYRKTSDRRSHCRPIAVWRKKP
jgi:hypothetical protein